MSIATETLEQRRGETLASILDDAQITQQDMAVAIIEDWQAKGIEVDADSAIAMVKTELVDSTDTSNLLALRICISIIVLFGFELQQAIDFIAWYDEIEDGDMLKEEYARLKEEAPAELLEALDRATLATMEPTLASSATLREAITDDGDGDDTRILVVEKTKVQGKGSDEHNELPKDEGASRPAAKRKKKSTRSRRRKKALPSRSVCPTVKGGAVIADYPTQHIVRFLSSLDTVIVHGDKSADGLKRGETLLTISIAVRQKDLFP